MKQYELTVLFHPDLEMNLTPATDKVEKIISDNGGHITNATNEGKRRLAYSIKGNDFGLYYFYELELPAEVPSKIESVLAITDEVIRSLLVKVDPRKLKAEAKRAARKVPAEASSEESDDEPSKDASDEIADEATKDSEVSEPETDEPKETTTNEEE